MEMIKYGLISKVDSQVLEKTVDLICKSNDEIINVTEIGVYGGDTGRGISEYLKSKSNERDAMQFVSSATTVPIKRRLTIIHALPE